MLMLLLLALLLSVAARMFAAALWLLPDADRVM